MYMKEADYSGAELTLEHLMEGFNKTATYYTSLETETPYPIQYIESIAKILSERTSEEFEVPQELRAD
jgi:hypothetical protein